MNNLLIIAVLVAILLAIIRRIRRNPLLRGAAGENKVSGILMSLPKDYYVINNVIVPNRQTTSQIDHVVVSPYGIFVIETKNYSGWVFGSENSEKWKETFKSTSVSFYNPIKQNWGHIYALAEYLQIDRRVFKPIIVFSNDASLNVESTTPVIYMSQLRELILSYNQEIISQGEVETLCERISKANLIGTDLGNSHTQNVRDDLSRQREAISQGKCPRCGGTLIKRSGKYGMFYGCSNYPQCKYTHNL